MPTCVKLPSSGCIQNVKATCSNHKPPCLPLWIRDCFPHTSFLVDTSESTVRLEKASSWREIWSTFIMWHSICTLATRLANIISSIMFLIFPLILFPLPVLACRESCLQLPSTYFTFAVSVKVSMPTQAPVSIWKHLDGRVVTPPCLKGEKKGIRAKVKVASLIFKRDSCDTALRKGIRNHRRMLELP